jgi:hypothetical protein
VWILTFWEVIFSCLFICLYFEICLCVVD